MKVFTRDYRIEHYDAPLFGEYFRGMKPCVLDIEATGLDPSRCKVVLMGLLTETEDGLRVTQFLAENHYEENRVLEATLEFLRDEGIDYIITFNGLRYDVPFINTRLEKLGFEDRLKIYDFDLYRFLRKCSVLPQQMDSLSQASVEARFGIAKDRQDTISGRESVALFDQFALSGDGTIEKIILTHNREDVLQLYKLMKIAGDGDFRAILPGGDGNEERIAEGDSQAVRIAEGDSQAVRIAEGESQAVRIAEGDSNGYDCDYFHKAIAIFGFPVANGRLAARPVLNAAKRELKICGDQIIEPFAAAYFPDIDRPLTATFSASTASFEIILPVDMHEGCCYIDLDKLRAVREQFVSDPDLINDFLILNDRTINKLASLLIEQYV